MNKSKFTFPVAALFLVCLLTAATGCFGQAQPPQQTEPSYEVVLHVLTASNTAGDKAEAVPQSLGTVVKKLRTNYSFSNYRLSSTYFQRVANTGNMEFKGVSNEPNQDVFAPVFSEWSLERLLTLPDARGQNTIAIQSFRFGQRVPVKTANFTEQVGKSNSVINYENVGLFLRKLNLPVGAPTIIGNLSTSKADELVFLILTVRPTEE
jgi:hypothetical protein